MIKRATNYEECIDMDRVALTILALFAAGAVISLLLSRFVRMKWVWYFPSMIGVLVISFFSLKIQFENLEGFEELGYIIINFMVAVVMIGNLLTNALIVLRKK
jgi:hypothetical protein